MLLWATYQCFHDDSTRCWPCEYLNLSRCAQQHIPQRGMRKNRKRRQVMEYSRSNVASVAAYLHSGARFSMNPITWSNLVENRFSDVMIPPLGPSLYWDITCLYFTISDICERQTERDNDDDDDDDERASISFTPNSSTRDSSTH